MCVKTELCLWPPPAVCVCVCVSVCVLARARTHPLPPLITPPTLSLSRSLPAGSACLCVFVCHSISVSVSVSLSLSLSCVLAHPSLNWLGLRTCSFLAFVIERRACGMPGVFRLSSPYLQFWTAEQCWVNRRVVLAEASLSYWSTSRGRGLSHSQLTRCEGRKDVSRAPRCGRLSKVVVGEGRRGWEEGGGGGGWKRERDYLWCRFWGTVWSCSLPYGLFNLYRIHVVPRAALAIYRHGCNGRVH